jgi:hypothetical protein
MNHDAQKTGTVRVVPAGTRSGTSTLTVLAAVRVLVPVVYSYSYVPVNFLEDDDSRLATRDVQTSCLLTLRYRTERHCHCSKGYHTSYSTVVK